MQNRVVRNTEGGRLSAGIRKALAGIPVLIKAQVAMLAFASVTCTAVVLLAGDRGVERTPFAIPAAIAAQSPWNDEVSHFAQRLHKAFGIRRATATEFSRSIVRQSTALLAQAGVPDPGRYLSALIHSTVDHALSDAGALGLGDPTATIDG